MNEHNEKTIPNGSISPELVAEARAGDQAAFTELYELTSAELYRSIRSMVRDEDLAWDILQDSYIRAWKGLEKLEANEAFLPWLRRIAVNVTATQMAQKRTLNFSALTVDGEDRERELEIPDLSIDNQPELALDRKETSRLVREILSELSEEQQIVVGMRYYEDMPINEIAKTLSIAPGTVKALLFKGRKKVEAGVRALEKQGVKLYGLSPLPFLIALLRRLEPARQAEKTALAAALAEAPAAGTAAGTAAGAALGSGVRTVTALTAGQAFLKGLGIKILAGVLAVAVLAGGGKLAYDALKEDKYPLLGDLQPSSAATLGIGETETEAASLAETEPEAQDLDEGQILGTGTCGDNLTWTLYSNGTLQIEGSGEMYDYEEENAPWYPLRERINAVVLPDELISVGDYAFFKLSGISSLTIPDRVTRIGNSAFRSCQCMQFLSLPEDLITIEEYAFCECAWLTTVAIPESVTSVGEGAFDECYNLESLIFFNANCNLDDFLSYEGDAVIYGYEGSTADRYAQYNGIPFTSLRDASNFSGQAGDDLTWTLDISTGSLILEGSGDMDFYGFDPPWCHLSGIITTVSLPERLTSIASSAFCDFAITSIDIPDGVTSIGNSAFSSCSKLTSAAIPSNVTSIGDSAFYYCSNWTPAAIPNHVISIGEHAFSGCDGFVSLTIPDSVTFIGDGAFSRCNGLISVSIPSSITSFGEDIFYQCTSLATVTIAEGLPAIADGMFVWCESLCSVNIPESVTSIGSEAFGGCELLQHVEIPANVTSIGAYAFHDCGLSSVSISEGVTSIEGSVFSGCNNLISVTIPPDVTSIGTQAFSDCNSLSSIAFPESVTTIGDFACYECAKLDSVTIPSKVSYIGRGAFACCENLSAIYVHPDNPYYSNDENGVLYDKDLTTLVACPCQKSTQFKIPASVTAIGSSAFGGCELPQTIEIPAGITSLGSYAFSTCTGLTSITIPDSITTVGEGLFGGCSSLTSVTIAGGAATVVNDMFLQCSALTSVTILDGITEIGESAFNDCESLSSVILPESLINIGDYAFCDCIALNSITIPKSVTSIEYYAFDGCENLTIRGAAGSAAERYANEHDIPFEATP